MMPGKQAVLLSLWDKLATLHDCKKQMSGVSLPIIGFNFNLSALSVTMPNKSRSDLVVMIRAFIRVPPSGHCRHTLQDFQCLTGWINWALNTYLLLRPGLAAIYNKILGKTQVHTSIALNLAVVHELSWLTHHLERSDGISLLLLLT